MKKASIIFGIAGLLLLGYTYYVMQKSSNRINKSDEAALNRAKLMYSNTPALRTKLVSPDNEDEYYYEDMELKQEDYIIINNRIRYYMNGANGKMGITNTYTLTDTETKESTRYWFPLNDTSLEEGVKYDAVIWTAYDIFSRAFEYENQKKLFGEISQIKTKFSSNLRPNKPIILKVYTDTIEFSTYDDNGDYFKLKGKKNRKDVSLIYDWEWYNNDKYNFKYGDIIKIKWKMDSVFIAGDGETVDFTEHAIDAEKIISKNKEVKFLWRAEKFDTELNQNFNSIFINDLFSNSISNQEKAALGYVATFIGNECQWDGKANENRSNLKCKILTALDLGYQCSDKHLDFLKNWFSKDSVTLKKLENCGTMPYTATVQTTFDEITLYTDKDDKTISVNYKAYGINIRESRKWSWSQTDNFKYNLKNVTLMNSEKSELSKENIEMNEN